MNDHSRILAEFDLSIFLRRSGDEMIHYTDLDSSWSVPILYLDLASIDNNHNDARL